jgi:hypothetical protein
VESEDKTDTYYEEKKTISRTNNTISDPAKAKTEVIEERSVVVPTSSNDVEVYKVQTSTIATTTASPPPISAEGKSTTAAEEKEEESISEKAREAGRSLKDLVYSLGKKTKEIAEEKSRDIRDQSVNISTTSDAHDIQSLGSDVDKLVNVFEETMTEIHKEPYNDQESLFAAYKRLLEEQIKVINARLELASRLKPGA